MIEMSSTASNCFRPVLNGSVSLPVPSYSPALGATPSLPPVSWISVARPALSSGGRPAPARPGARATPPGRAALGQRAKARQLAGRVAEQGRQDVQAVGGGVRV